MTTSKAGAHPERVVALRAYAPVPAGTAGAETMLATLAESQREMFNFVRMRLEKDSDAARKVVACRNWTEAVEAQTQWAQEMVQDYTAGMTRMMSLYTGAPQPSRDAA
jgi:hypothetical protein